MNQPNYHNFLFFTIKSTNILNSNNHRNTHTPNVELLQIQLLKNQRKFQYFKTSYKHNCFLLLLLFGYYIVIITI